MDITGKIVEVNFVKSSGSKAYDKSVIMAVIRTKKLDMPSDPEIAKRARRLRMVFSNKNHIKRIRR